MAPCASSGRGQERSEAANKVQPRQQDAHSCTSGQEASKGSDPLVTPANAKVEQFGGRSTAAEGDKSSRRR